MNKSLLALTLIILRTRCASAEVFTYNPSLLIPDNAGSISDSRTVSSAITRIGSIKVTLNIAPVSEAVNGDYYAYLQNSQGGTTRNAWLLNRIGTTDASNPLDAGNFGNGMAITLYDAAAQDIHLAPTPSGTLTGFWQPDGRSADPDKVKESSLRTSRLSTFDNLDANGSWTLFIGDASSGGEARLETWSLEFTGVPEPAEWAAISAVALLGFGIWRRHHRSDRPVQS